MNPMTIQEHKMPLPVERIGDVAAHFQHLGNFGTPEFDTWLHAKIEGDGIISRLEDRDKPIPERILDTLSFWHDVALIMRPLAEAYDSRYTDRDDETYGKFRPAQLGKIATNAPNGTRVQEIVEGGRNFTNQELVDIGIANLASTYQFLSTGDRKSFWPTNFSYAQEQIGDWEEAQDYEALIVVARHIDGDDPKATSAQAVNEGLAKLGTLYAENGLLGRAIGVLSVLDSQDQASVLLDSVVNRMLVEKDKFGDESYQRDFQYAGSMLQGNTLAKFKELLVPSSIPPIPGAKRSFERVGNSEWMIEEWDEDAPIEAATSRRDKVTLPFTDYRSRAVMNRGGEAENAMYDRRYSVDFYELEPEIQARVLDRISGNFPETPSQVDLEKIVFGFGYCLKTMDVSIGEWKLMNMLDPTAIVEDKNDSGDIREIEHVQDGWLATDYSGSYLQMEGFSLTDIQAIAPPNANTFWFSGIPRQVILPDSITPAEGTHGVVLTPISFYEAKKELRL